MTDPTSPLHRPAVHESGLRHATGAALYVDDLPTPRGMLVAQVLPSPVARGVIRGLDVTAARAVPGVAAVLTARDIPATNDISAVAHDEPLLAAEEVFTTGQPIALVVADQWATCRRALAEIQLQIEPRPALLDLRSGLAAGAFLTPPHVIARGDVAAALASAPLVLEGEVETGGQDHFYLETHAALALPDENGTIRVVSSTQHPTEVQAKIAEILGLGQNQVTVEVPRMGGGFGGKETQAAHWAAMAALAAWKTQRPVKVWLNRDQDMMITGKRHPWLSRYRAGFDRDGRFLALSVETFSDGGWCLDLSRAILDRCLFHLDNGYYIPHVFFSGRVVRTNTPSNTAFRGFGGPQGVVVVESILNRVAERLQLDPAEVRRRNFYGEPPRDKTPYEQVVEDCRLPRIWDELKSGAEYDRRRAEIRAFNERSAWIKRGLAFAPVKFGISFTTSLLNQAGALVLVYADGTVQLNHGGTEMGQGLHTKMLAICAHELGVPLSRIRAMITSTEKVPNTSATAASSGADLNGQAVRDACSLIRERLRTVAARQMGVDAEDAPRILFADGVVSLPGASTPALRFEDVARAAHAQQVSLSATGYYHTPNIHYDARAGRGKPFHYFAYGGSVVEVEVNGLTGEHRVVRVDILHDVGDSLVPTVDRGQIEGGFVQGLGWLTCEELVWDREGALRTHSPDTYKVPAIGEAPPEFHVKLLERAHQPNVIHGSKAVGEPPLMLAVGVITALREAIRAFAALDPKREVELRIPCTPESVLRAIDGIRGPARLDVDAWTAPAEAEAEPKPERVDPIRTAREV